MRYFTKKSNGHYYCLHCNFESDSLMGMLAHAGAHKRKFEKLGSNQKTLDGSKLNIDANRNLF